MFFHFRILEKTRLESGCVMGFSFQGNSHSSDFTIYFVSSDKPRKQKTRVIRGASGNFEVACYCRNFTWVTVNICV